MTLWHASNELLTTATAGVAKTVYTAAEALGLGDEGLGLDTSG